MRLSRPKWLKTRARQADSGATGLALAGASSVGGTGHARRNPAFSMEQAESLSE
jgi:hypothetical protein